MGIFRKIRESETWDNHKEVVFFLLIFVLGFSFLPVWLTLFIIFLTGKWANVGDLWSNGAFFIYSAALLGSAIEMMHGYPKKGSVSFISFLYYFSWFLILLSTAGFVVAILPNILPQGSQVETKTITITSFAFVFLSLTIIYYARYYELRKPNPEGENRKLQEDIMAKLS